MGTLRTSLVIASVGVIVVTGACAGDADVAGDAASTSGSARADRALGGDGGPAEGYDVDADRSGAAAAALPDVGLDVIKTAKLEMGVGRDRLDGAIDDAIGIAGRYGGFVLSSSSDTADAESGRVTLRVPSARFEAALGDIKSLGDVRAETVTGEDVGEEFVDLRARLNNWQTQEAVLLKLYDDADTIEETIRVQGEVARVQLQIEQIRGRLRFLEDQTALGTITTSFTTIAVPSEPSGRFARAWQQAVDMMEGITAAMILSLGFVMPLALLGLVALVVIRVMRPKLKTGEF